MCYINALNKYINNTFTNSMPCQPVFRVEDHTMGISGVIAGAPEFTGHCSSCTYMYICLPSTSNHTEESCVHPKAVTLQIYFITLYKCIYMDLYVLRTEPSTAHQVLVPPNCISTVLYHGTMSLIIGLGPMKLKIIENTLMHVNWTHDLWILPSM